MDYAVVWQHVISRPWWCVCCAQHSTQHTHTQPLSLKGVYRHSVTDHNTQSILKQDKKEYNNNTLYTLAAQSKHLQLQSS